MNLSRKDFLLRSGAAVFPISLATAGASLAAEKMSPPAGDAQFDVRQFGAKGDGETKDTQALQAAMDAAGVRGGTVYLPPGRYLSGTVRFKSHVTVFLDAGATLVFSPDKADFEPYEKLSFHPPDDYETTDFHYALLRGQDVEHVTVAGPGMIEGNRTKRGGPKPLAFKNCRHVTVRDITIRNSPNYNISLLGCEFVDILGVTILNGYCDGIDPDSCRFVRIANCYVESWDDAIVPKASFALGRPALTEHLTVTNCVLTTACNCFKLGTESCGDFKNITVSNCAMFGRPDLWRRNPNSGISLEMVDGGHLERVTVSNIVMADIQTPIFVRLGNRGRAQAPPTAGSLHDVSIADICATGASRASSITGIPGHAVSKITLSNVRISTRGGGSAEQASKDVPELEAKYPDADMFGVLPAYGLFCRHADTLVIENMHLHLEQLEARPAVIIDRAVNVQLRGCSAAAPSGVEPGFWLRNLRGCLLQGLCAQPGTQNCIKVSGEQTSAVRAVANDFTEATAAFQLGGEVPSTALRQQANLLPV